MPYCKCLLKASSKPACIVGVPEGSYKDNAIALACNTSSIVKLQKVSAWDNRVSWGQQTPIRIRDSQQYTAPGHAFEPRLSCACWDSYSGCLFAVVSQAVVRMSEDGEGVVVAGHPAETELKDGIGCNARFAGYGTNIVSDGEGCLYLLDGGRLRMLQLPAAWRSTTTTGTSGPAAAGRSTAAATGPSVRSSHLTRDLLVPEAAQAGGQEREEAAVTGGADEVLVTTLPCGRLDGWLTRGSYDPASRSLILCTRKKVYRLHTSGWQHPGTGVATGRRVAGAAADAVAGAAGLHGARVDEAAEDVAAARAGAGAEGQGSGAVAGSEGAAVRVVGTATGSDAEAAAAAAVARGAGPGRPGGIGMAAAAAGVAVGAAAGAGPGAGMGLEEASAGAGSAMKANAEVAAYQPVLMADLTERPEIEEDYDSRIGGVAVDGTGSVWAAVLMFHEHFEVESGTELHRIDPNGGVSNVAGGVGELSNDWFSSPTILRNGCMSLIQRGLEAPDDILLLHLDVAPPAYPQSRGAGPSSCGSPDSQTHTLSSDLGALLARQPDGSADVEVEVGGQVFAAHRSVLAARSPYFRQRLDPGAGFADAGGPRLSLPAADPGAFAAVLRYMYTDSAGAVPPELLQPVGELADRLLLPGLCAHVGQQLLWQVRPGNVVGLLLWAERRRESYKELRGELKDWFRGHHAQGENGWVLSDEEVLRLMQEGRHLAVELLYHQRPDVRGSKRPRDE